MPLETTPQEKSLALNGGQGWLARIRFSISRLALLHAIVILAGTIAFAAGHCLWYVPVAERFLRVPSDHTTHVQLAEQLYHTHRLATPHFLYQAAIALLVTIDSALSFKTAALMVLAGALALTGAVVYRLAASTFVPTNCPPRVLLGRSLAAVLAAACILVMQPIILPADSQLYHIGYFWAELYYSPTYEIMKPLALVSAIFAAQFLCRNPGEVSSLRIAIAALAIILARLAKPSFLICLVPATLVVAMIRWHHRAPLDRKAVLLGLLLPSIGVLGVQYILTYSGLVSTVDYSDAITFAPLKVLRFYSTNLFGKFVLSTLFPAAVYAVYWRRASKDASLGIAALSFAIGAGYGFLLAEREKWWAGNFLYSGYIALFVLFASAVLFYVRQVLDGPRGPWQLARHGLVLLVLILHVRSGVLTEIAFLNAKLGQYGS